MVEEVEAAVMLVGVVVQRAAVLPAAEEQARATTGARRRS